MIVIYLPILGQCVVALLNQALCYFVHQTLSNKPLGQQTFLDLCLKGFFMSYCISSTNTFLLSISSLLMTVPSVFIIFWGFILELMTIWPFVWMLLCVIVRSLEIYTNLISGNVFNEAKVLWKFSIFSLSFPSATLLIEFLTIHDIKEMATYRMLCQKYQISVTNASYTFLFFVLVNCLCLAILQWKIELDKYNNNETTSKLVEMIFRTFVPKHNHGIIEHKPAAVKPGILTFFGTLLTIIYFMLYVLMPLTSDGSLWEYVIFAYYVTMAGITLPLLFIFGSPLLAIKFKQFLSSRFKYFTIYV